ncbi:MAG: hypothetical protein R6U98_11515, partial [Pirellulaceae bacterium]
RLCRTRLHPTGIRPSGRIEKSLSRKPFRESSVKRRRIARFGVARNHGQEIVIQMGGQTSPCSSGGVSESVANSGEFAEKSEMVGAVGFEPTTT